MSNREQKIEKINAYKKLIEQKRLPKIPDDKAAQAQNPDDPSTWPVEQQIHAEFTAWAEGQLAGLLGEENPNAPFSDEQAEVLRQWADRMMSKANQSPVETVKRAVSTSSPQLKRPEYRANPNARPLGKREPAGQQKFDKKTQNYLADLEKLDRDGPDY